MHCAAKSVQISLSRDRAILEVYRLERPISLETRCLDLRIRIGEQPARMESQPTQTQYAQLDTYISHPRTRRGPARLHQLGRGCGQHRSSSLRGLPRASGDFGLEPCAAWQNPVIRGDSKFFFAWIPDDLQRGLADRGGCLPPIGSQPGVGALKARMVRLFRTTSSNSDESPFVSASRMALNNPSQCWACLLGVS